MGVTLPNRWVFYYKGTHASYVGRGFVRRRNEAEHKIALAHDERVCKVVEGIGETVEFEDGVRLRYRPCELLHA